MMQNWLTEREKDAVVKKFIKWELIKWDNERKLSLKKGGTTDVYVMLRNIRNYPKAQKYFGRIFANPLLRLGAKSFIEVPASVSGLASQISTRLDIPYITVREKAKEGRVADATHIGTFKRGKVTPVIDDVITDGASKLVPYEVAKKNGVAPNVPIVVAVDRQQGWREKFAQLGIKSEVWAGMTLHDVRRRLIDWGCMERCDLNVEKKNPMIVALDGKNWETILPVVDELRPTGTILKVNDMMFNQGIENIMPNLQVYGRVMADLKSHDISFTVSNIMQHLVPCPPWAVTVHASGGGEMISAAVKTLNKTDTKVLAVTVLTSIDPDTCEEIYRRRPKSQVKKLARIACDRGAHGFVCSGKEVKMLKKRYPRMIAVVPGVRSPGVDKGDQKRVNTPVKVMKKGADYLVMGRQIFGADDPVAEVNRLVNSELYKQIQKRRI